MWVGTGRDGTGLRMKCEEVWSIYLSIYLSKDTRLEGGGFDNIGERARRRESKYAHPFSFGAAPLQSMSSQLRTLCAVQIEMSAGV